MTLSAKRQVVLPADLCRQIALYPGARVQVRLAADGSAILIEPVGKAVGNALHLAQAGHCGHLATFDARFRKLAKRLKLHPPVLAV